DLLHLIKIQFYRRRSSENSHKHLNLRLVRPYLFDNTREVCERPFHNFDCFAPVERHFRLRLERPLFALLFYLEHFVFLDVGHGIRIDPSVLDLAADKTYHFRYIADEVPAPVTELHFHQYVTRKELSDRGLFLAALDRLDNGFRRDQDFDNLVVEPLLLGPVFNIGLNPVLEAGIGMNYVPSFRHRKSLSPSPS